jgi:hypothetical protein
MFVHFCKYAQKKTAKETIFADFNGNRSSDRREGKERDAPRFCP